MKPTFRYTVAFLLCAALPALAQDHHAMGMSSGAPALSGQYAFATISDIVKALKADASTDWSKVNLEALRQHLIDMDDVILRSTVVSRRVTGGLQMDVTGTGRTSAAIRRMVGSHAH